jgi:hypothetical protein
MTYAVLPLTLICMFTVSCISLPVPTSPGNQLSSSIDVAASQPSQRSTPDSSPAQHGTSGTVPTVLTSQPESTTPAKAGTIEDEIATLIARAAESIDANRLAEGIKYYVAALGRASRAGLKHKVDEIVGIINTAGTKLTIEPHESWIATDGTQVPGDTRTASRGEGLMPTVFLHASYGYAKSVVPDAMIRFEFLSNNGTITGTVTTDSRGMANATISSIASPAREAIIRAYPLFTADGFTYAFKTIFRDFTYLPLPNQTLVVALEKTSAGYSANPRVLDTVAGSLKKIGSEVIPFNGSIAPERFMSALGGDRTALAAFSGNTNWLGYYTLVYVEIPTPEQMVVQGRVYNIFITNAKVTIRTVQANGSVIFTEVMDGIRGQGGSVQAAIEDSLAKTHVELAGILDTRSSSIRSAFGF